MSIPLFQVDAFTSEIFKGNPAAVCILSEPAESAWMQSVAREMNLSETAFLSPRNDGYGLRWFTPEAEVEFAGMPRLQARMYSGKPVMCARRQKSGSTPFPDG